MDASHSVDGVRPHDAQMSHVDFLSAAFLDQGHSAQTVVVSRVELTDALEGQTNEVLNAFPAASTHAVEILARTY